MKTDVRSQILPAEAASAQAGTENGLISYLVIWLSRYLMETEVRKQKAEDRKQKTEKQISYLVISLFGYLGEQGELVI
ncbi:MAG: hypothetical protein KA059_05740 [Elusimicrobiales bacterium]|nr:hypothetical protein [Elusimicrobiales bacterium]